MSETVVETPKKAPKAPKKASAPKKAAKPAKEKEGRGMTFNQLMKTRLDNGQLRKAHVEILKTLNKNSKPLTKNQIAEKSGVNLRTVFPAVDFLAESSLAKSQVASDESGDTVFLISATGKKELEKASA